MIESVNIPYEMIWPIESRSKIVRVDSIKDEAHLKEIVENIKKTYTENSDDMLLSIDVDSAKRVSFTSVEGIGLHITVTDSASVNVLKKLAEEVNGIKINVNVAVEEGAFIGLMQKMIDLLDHDIRLFMSTESFKGLKAKEWKFIVKNIMQRPDIVHKVYPFYYILRYVVIAVNKEKLDFSLWELFFEQLGYFYYMSDDKKISLSKRFVDSGEVFGSVPDEFSKIKDSKFFKEVENLEMDVFFTYGDCSVCEKYDVCKSFLKFQNNDYDCSEFLGAIDFINSRIEGIASIYKDVERT